MHIHVFSDTSFQAQELYLERVQISWKQNKVTVLLNIGKKLGINQACYKSFLSWNMKIYLPVLVV